MATWLRRDIFACCLLALGVMGVQGGEVPQAVFGTDGLTGLQWRGASIVGRDGFAVESVVLEATNGEGGNLWGRHLFGVEPGRPHVAVDREAGRVTRRYDWGEIETRYVPGPGRLAIELQVRNTGPQAIADLRVRLLELGLRDAPSEGARAAFYTVDRPVWFKLPIREAHIFAVCETFETPILFGYERAGDGARDAPYALVFGGGVPADKGDSLVQPLLGMPHIDAGAVLDLRFVLYFAGVQTPDSDVLQPYMEAFRAAQGEPMNWLDRRPVGRLVIPGSPNRVTVANPRGWFDDPRLDTGSVAGQADLRARVLALADRTLDALAAVDAQGVVIWNLEGRHIYPVYPMGDPRQLDAIAPEMDAVADALFARFREAGYRTGVTLRPQNLYHSPVRQNWALGPGAYDPERESLDGADRALAAGYPAERVYPLAARLIDKIGYARERWGCTIFYIEDNGSWRRVSQDRLDEWFLFDARVLAQVRAAHPDVLLIPRYAERYWRPARTDGLRALLDRERRRTREPDPEASEADQTAAWSQLLLTERNLRGIDGTRIGNAPTPPWVAASYLVLDRARWFRAERVFSGPRHVLREAYWANSAPFIRMNERERIIAYIRSLGQHNEYTEVQAAAMADELIAFDHTPSAVRDWLPDAFSIKDLTGAQIAPRHEMIVRGAAWGDVLMWDVTTDPGEIGSMMAMAGARQDRVHEAARQLGLLPARAAGADRLPLSLLWRRGEALDAGRLVAGGRVPDDLRARAVYSTDRGSALLLVGWRGRRGQAVELARGLAELDLDGAEREAWCLDTGRYLPGGVPIRVTPDVVAGLSALLVRVTERPGTPLPRGVLLGARFDRGLAPVLGGGMPSDVPPPRGDIQDGALQLAGADVGYPIVPEWEGGAIAFDVRVERADAEGLRVLRVRHHLDADLTLVTRGGTTGLLLEARETGPDPDTAGPRTIFAPLPGSGWHRVVLNWDAGQYELIVDGVSAGMATGPVGRRSRDGAVMTAGLLLGDAAPAGGGRAWIDGVSVHDWPVPPEAVAGRRGRIGLDPVTAADQPMTIWMWGAFPEAVQMAVNARSTGIDWSLIEHFEVKLYERMEAGRLQVGSARLPATGGIGAGALAFRRATAAEVHRGASERGRGRDPGLDIRSPGRDSFDIGDLLGDDLKLDDPYVVIVEAHGRDGRLIARTLEFEASAEGISRHRW